MTYIAHGRCRSGSRWFWIAAEHDFGDAHKCDDPVCVYGGPHEYGWEDTEDLAVKAMAEAVTTLGGEVFQGCYRGNAPGRAGTASDALKRINTAKRKARPPKTGTSHAAPVEYLYEPWSWTDYDNPPYETRKGISKIPVAKKTAKRIYYDASDSWDRQDGVTTLGYLDRREFESDTRCPGYSDGRCEHGYWGSHGYAPGETQLPSGRWRYGGGHVFATREAAEEDLYSRDRERERKRAEHEPELKRLRKAMADAHPDRGGTNEEFIAARERYQQALRRAS